MNDCAHPKIVAWVDTKTQKPAALWSCAACDQRFVPMSELLAVESKLEHAAIEFNAMKGCYEIQRDGRIEAERRLGKALKFAEHSSICHAWPSNADQGVIECTCGLDELRSPPVVEKPEQNPSPLVRV